MRAFLRRWFDILVRVSLAPVAFMGVGVYRAWLATFFRFGAYPGVGFAEYAVFETSIGVASLAAAFLARRIAPLWSNARCTALTIALTTGGSVAIVIACLGMPATTPGLVALRAALLYGGLVAAGLGLGLLILAWCEFYASLNPLRVAVYHALSILFGEALLWLCMGLRVPWVATLSVVLPAISAGFVHRAALALPESDRPQARPELDSARIPWKPIILMATCTFAMQFGALPVQPLLAGNVAGVAFATLFVFFGVLSTSRWFNFDTIYRVAFPLVSVACMLATSLISDHPQLSAWCFDAGYTMLSMFIMIVLSNITYRFGVNAVWLNGIERGIRYLVETAGFGLNAVVASSMAPGAARVVGYAVTGAVVVTFAVIALSEKELAAKWGIDLHADEESAGADGFAPLPALSLRVSELSREHGLSDREEEVLQLMARRMSTREMGEVLFLAEGTVKAHTSRIYRKLGVHNRQGLNELLGIREDAR